MCNFVFGLCYWKSLIKFKFSSLKWLNFGMGLSNMKHCAYVCFETKKPSENWTLNDNLLMNLQTNYGHSMQVFFFNIPFWTDWANQQNKFWGILGVFLCYYLLKFCHCVSGVTALSKIVEGVCHFALNN